MTTIESKKVQVHANRKDIFDYLSDLNNFQELLPKDNISNWQSSETECSFKVTGGYTIGLKHKEFVGEEKIILESTEASPFPFTLNIFLNQGVDGIEAFQKCEADINPFLKMVVQKPLKNLFDYIADRLVKKYNS